MEYYYRSKYTATFRTVTVRSTLSTVETSIRYPEHIEVTLIGGKHFFNYIPLTCEGHKKNKVLELCKKNKWEF